jgi:glycosyltransferase involved in cell wall biosynthesis
MAADGVAFISDTIRRQARETGLLPEGTPSCVAYLGIDEQPAVTGPEACPSRCESVADGFLLVLGASFLHKNRLWAIKLVRELVSVGWGGHLILAGPTPSYGSSQQAEEDYLTHHQEVRERVLDLGSVSPREKHWLYAHAGLVLYPTLSEGFGMIPFEAADAGTPCLSTRQGSLGEVLPNELLTLDSLALTPARDLVLEILSDQKLGHAMVASVAAQRAKYSWDAASEEITDLLWAVTARPRRNVAAVEVASGRLTLRATAPEQPLRRIIDPLAAMARESKNVQKWLLPPGTRRGYISRRAYHRLAGDERPRRSRRVS